MIKKIIALSALSFSVFAYQGEGFKIVSEKFTSTPGFGGGFVSVDNVPQPAKNPNVWAKACARDASGRVKDYISVSGCHNVQIYNNTGNVQRFTYTYSLKCEDAHQVFERTLDINPQGTFTDMANSSGTVQKLNSGDFPIISSTKISGADTASDEAKATLRVSK
jgi:hypothetical protein